MNHNSELHLTGLHYQLSEHFIFNVMNTLRVLVRKDQQQATEMLNIFSEYLRYALHKTKDFHTTIEKELEGISLFLRLQEIRFKKKITLTPEIPPELLCKNIPAFILQPYTELLLKQAASSSDSGTQLSFEAALSGQLLHFTWTCEAIQKSVNTTEVYFSPKSDAELGCEYAASLGKALYQERFEQHSFIKDNQYTIHLQIPA